MSSIGGREAAPAPVVRDNSRLMALDVGVNELELGGLYGVSLKPGGYAPEKAAAAARAVKNTAIEAVQAGATAAEFTPLAPVSAAASVVNIGLDVEQEKYGSAMLNAGLGVAAGALVKTPVKGKLDDLAGVAGREADDLSSLQKINGHFPRNYRLAGKTLYLPGEVGKKYPAGVAFTKEGFPDFSPYAIKTVKPKGLSGIRRKDVKLANAEAGFTATPSGYTWHHHENMVTMQLVPTKLHQAVGHTGSVAMLGGW